MYILCYLPRHVLVPYHSVSCTLDYIMLYIALHNTMCTVLDIILCIPRRMSHGIVHIVYCIGI